MFYNHLFKEWLQPVADPGFPEVGAPTPRGGHQHTILPKFPKLHEIERFGRGGWRGGASKFTK